METHVADLLANPGPASARPRLLQWLVLAGLIVILLTAGLILAIVAHLRIGTSLRIAAMRRPIGRRRLANTVRS